MKQCTCFLEKGIRGACSFVNQHHIKRNVSGESDFNDALPRIEMLYIDAVSQFKKIYVFLLSA